MFEWIKNASDFQLVLGIVLLGLASVSIYLIFAKRKAEKERNKEKAEGEKE